MHRRHGDEVLQTLELPGNDDTRRLITEQTIISMVLHIDRRDGPTYPGACVADVQMIPALFRREPGAGLLGNPLAERADLALELARLVAGEDPVRDFAAGGLDKT